MNYIVFAISLLSSIIGSICGIGGGVIIKPVLDATGLMEVSTISFLSGCTVLSMSVISLLKRSRKNTQKIAMQTSTILAIGAVVGGILGKRLFEYVYLICSDKNKVGAIQALVLIVVTVGSFLYTVMETKIKTYCISNIFLSMLVGLMLGMMSAFLGIGGGPINIIILSFLFSMHTKKAADTSLYIIMFSQAASFLSTVIENNVPLFEKEVLFIMIIGGIVGGIIGSNINQKLREDSVKKLFCISMVVIILINIYNVYNLGGRNFF